MSETNEKDFYVFSNYSAFQIELSFKFTKGGENTGGFNLLFQTSEQLYHYFKFSKSSPFISLSIQNTRSPQQAFELAEKYKEFENPNWNKIKNNVMRYIVFLKTQQHDFILQKLLSTGDKEIIENSWDDNYGKKDENQNNQNQLGKIWMELRTFINNNPNDWPYREVEFAQKNLFKNLFSEFYGGTSVEW